jgi:hypothetical protein
MPSALALSARLPVMAQPRQRGRLPPFKGSWNCLRPIRKRRAKLDVGARRQHLIGKNNVTLAADITPSNRSRHSTAAPLSLAAWATIRLRPGGGGIRGRWHSVRIRIAVRPALLDPGAKSFEDFEKLGVWKTIINEWPATLRSHQPGFAQQPQVKRDVGLR